ncbi:MAG TPA: GntR family transcriptional regulator [Streptosporangiaceae bacterium]|nr:GntR family transcriptional regulator [Streptosporangiaceae bacterium]
MTSGPPAVRPIESRSVAEQVTAELRRSILSGALPPGREFSLRGLADQLQVSFIPVREALRVLEGEGLVITRPGRSAMVTPLDLDDLRAIYRLREVLEPEIAGRSCLLLSDHELDQLERQAAGFADVHGGIGEMYESHHALHLALLRPAATAWDIRMLTTLWRAAERYIRIGFSRLDPDPHESKRREQVHRELIAAFRQRDPEVAAGAVLEHLAANEQTALKALDEEVS